MDPSCVTYKSSVLFSSVFRSFTIKAVQKLIVCILPALVHSGTISHTGQYWWLHGPPPLYSITVYKINSFSTIGSSAWIETPWTTAVTPWDRESLNAPVELTGGRPYLNQDNSNIGGTMKTVMGLLESTKNLDQHRTIFFDNYFSIQNFVKNFYAVIWMHVAQYVHVTRVYPKQ